MPNFNFKSVDRFVRDVINEAKIKRKRKKMIEDVAMQKAKQKYKERTGKEMTSSKLRLEFEGINLSKKTKQYLKDKKTIVKRLKQKMKAKKVY